MTMLMRSTAGARLSLRKPEDIAKLRVVAARLDRFLGRRPKGAKVRRIEMGSVAGEWIEVAESASDRVILHMHGGGFVARTPALHLGLVARLCRTARALALIPDYRLAPESPFPAQLNDGFTTYQWLLEKGYDPARIALTGDSAGGTLALALLFQIRDAGLALPACAVLISPATDLAEPGASYRENAKRDWLGADWEAIQVLVDAYRAGADPRDPLLSPARGKFHGLPPLYLIAAENEVLRDDSLLAARCAQAAGVSAVAEVWGGGVPHVFPALGFLPESRAASERIGRFVRAHTGEPSCCSEATAADAAISEVVTAFDGASRRSDAACA